MGAGREEKKACFCWIMMDGWLAGLSVGNSHVVFVGCRRAYISYPRSAASLD